MGFEDLMAQIRHWDNRSAKWMMRHIYILFFEVFLVVIFFAFFVNVIQVINISTDVPKSNATERLLLSQSTSLLIIVLLMLLNSFWMLYMFSSIIRLRTILREMNFNLSKRPRNNPST